VRSSFSSREDMDHGDHAVRSYYATNSGQRKPYCDLLKPGVGSPSNLESSVM